MCEKRKEKIGLSYLSNIHIYVNYIQATHSSKLHMLFLHTVQLSLTHPAIGFIFAVLNCCIYIFMHQGLRHNWDIVFSDQKSKTEN